MHHRQDQGESDIYLYLTKIQKFRQMDLKNNGIFKAWLCHHNADISSDFDHKN